MDQNIADLLKEAFSETDIDFEREHDEYTNSLQIPLDIAEDMENMMDARELGISAQGLVETLTTIYEQKENDASSDTSESESSSSFNTKPTSCLSQEIDINQAVNMMMAETQQQEEGNFEAGVSDEKQTEKEQMDIGESEYELQMLPLKVSPSLFEETSSESDEEEEENCSTSETSSRCESLGNKNEWLIAMSPRDDMKEFTEEDQEEIEDSLADYPSDLSNSETEEPSEDATAQLFTVGFSSSVDNSTVRMEEFTNVEILQNTDSPELDYNSGIRIVKDHLKSAEIAVSFQKRTSVEKNDQEYLTEDRYTMDGAQYKDNAGDLGDFDNGAEDVSYSRCDDTISSAFISTQKQKKENHVIQHNISTEDQTDDDLGYIHQNLKFDLGSKSPEKKDEVSNIESHCSITLVQSDTTIKNHDISSYASEMTKNTITEVLWSSSLLMDEDNLRLEEYDWNLTGDESFMISLGELNKQEYTEEALEELDIGDDDDDNDDDDDDEENKRDWELEKTRIEAFYRFYGDPAEPEVQVERNHKVSFHLDQESSSSECYEDSDSTEEELDSDLNTPDLNILKPEYHSESDEEPLEKSYYPERSKIQPKGQQPSNASVKQPTYRNKCLAVLKSMLAFGLLTTIGIVSFWWVTENMVRID